MTIRIDAQPLYSPLVIHDPLVPELLEKLADIGANLGGIGVAELSLQFCNDLPEGALAVAPLEHLSSGALQFDCAFGKQDDTFFLAAGLTLRSPAATGCQAGLAGILGRRHVSVVSRKHAE
jgi:hypothetical protein